VVLREEEAWEEREGTEVEWGLCEEDDPHPVPYPKF
jgi:hypothetical protein